MFIPVLCYSFIFKSGWRDVDSEEQDCSNPGLEGEKVLKVSLFSILNLDFIQEHIFSVVLGISEKEKRKMGSFLWLLQV